MKLGPGEPLAGPWTATAFDIVVARLLGAAGVHEGRPAILAVDGRGGGGKSTLAGRIADAVPGTAVVHTDDLAWGYSIFGWEGVLRDGVLDPLRRSESVDLRPPGWEKEGREGSVIVPAGLDLVIVEGTGAARRDAADLVDASVWLQGDFDAMKVRCIDRDVLTGVNGDRAGALAFWDLWQAEEQPFFAADRPWEHVDAIVATTPVIPLADDELAVAPTVPPRTPSGHPAR